MEDLLQIGMITSPHGVHGEMKVFPTTDDPKRYKKLKSCKMDTGKEIRNVEIESCKFFKQFVIIKLAGIDSMDDAQKYRQSKLLIPRDQAVKLAKNEYFICDLMDCQVITEDKQVLGTLTDVLSTGANDVYVVECEGKKEVLIPAIRECILSVDTKAKLIEVHLLEGLVEE